MGETPKTLPKDFKFSDAKPKTLPKDFSFEEPVKKKVVAEQTATTPASTTTANSSEVVEPVTPPLNQNGVKIELPQETKEGTLESVLGIKLPVVPKVEQKEQNAFQKVFGITESKPTTQHKTQQEVIAEAQKSNPVVLKKQFDETTKESNRLGGEVQKIQNNITTVEQYPFMKDLKLINDQLAAIGEPKTPQQIEAHNALVSKYNEIRDTPIEAYEQPEQGASATIKDANGNEQTFELIKDVGAYRKSTRTGNEELKKYKTVGELLDANNEQITKLNKIIPQLKDAHSKLDETKKEYQKQIGYTGSDMGGWESFGHSLNGTMNAIGDYILPDDMKEKVWRDRMLEEQLAPKEAKGATGMVGEVAGGLAPFVAGGVLTGGESWIANAITQGLLGGGSAGGATGYETYREEILNGRNTQEAMALANKRGNFAAGTGALAFGSLGLIGGAGLRSTIEKAFVEGLGGKVAQKTATQTMMETLEHQGAIAGIFGGDRVLNNLYANYTGAHKDLSEGVVEAMMTPVLLGAATHGAIGALKLGTKAPKAAYDVYTTYLAKAKPEVIESIKAEGLKNGEEPAIINQLVADVTAKAETLEKMPQDMPFDEVQEQLPLLQQKKALVEAKKKLDPSFVKQHLDIDEQIKNIDEQIKSKNDATTERKIEESNLAEHQNGNESGETTTSSNRNSVEQSGDEQTQTTQVDWVRGINDNNKSGEDKFYSTDKSVSADYGVNKAGEKPTLETLPKEEHPKNPLVVNDKQELADIIGYEGDPFTEKLNTPVDEKFDTKAKKYAKSKGHDAIIYEEGSLGAKELHLFHNPITEHLPDLKAVVESQHPITEEKTKLIDDVKNIVEGLVKHGAISMEEAIDHAMNVLKIKLGLGDTELVEIKSGLLNEKEISTKNAVADEIRNDIGLPKVDIPADRTKGEGVATGKELFASGEVDPLNVVNRLLSDKNIYDKEITPNDEPVMRYYLMQLSAKGNELFKQSNEIAEKLKAEPDNVELLTQQAETAQQLLKHYDEMGRALDAERIGGNVWHKYGMERQTAINEKGQIVNSINRIKTAYGDNVPEVVQKQLTELQQKYDELVAKNQAIEEKLKEEVAKKGFDKAKQEQKKQVRTIKRTELAEREKIVVDRIKTKISDIISRYAEKTGGKLNAVEGDELKKNILSELASDISELMKIQIDKGALNISDVIDGIHGQLNGVIDGLKKEDVRDLIAGKYSEKKPLSELTKQLNDFRSQAKALENIEKLQNDIEIETKKRGEASPEVKALQKQLQELKTTKGLQQRIEDVKSGVEKKIREKGEQSDEVKALRKELADLESQEGLKKRITDLENGVVSETKKRGEASPEVKALQEKLKTARKNAPNKFADVSAAEIKKKADAVQKKIDKGEFAKTPHIKTLWENNPNWKANNQERIKLVEKLRKLEREAMDSQKNMYMKGLDWINRWGRRVIFFGSTAVYTKLSSAAVAGSFAHRIPEQALGVGFAKLFPKIAGNAPIEGEFNVAAEAKFYQEFLNPKTFFKNTWDIFKTGKTDLSREFDKHYGDHHLPVIDLFAADSHIMIKDPVKRAKFEASLINHLTFWDNHGVDYTHPLMLESARQAAYKSAENEIFQGHEGSANAVNKFFNDLEKDGIVKASLPDLSSKISGNVNYTAASLYHFFVPINTVPLNIMKRVTGGLMFPITLGKAFAKNAAIKKGILSLSQEQSDIIMRDLKKGAIGAAYWGLGLFLVGNAGGLWNRYNQDPKNKESKRKDGTRSEDLQIAGQEISHNVQHTTQLTSLQMGATYARVYNHYINDKGASVTEAMAAATAATTGAGLRNVPTFEEGMKLGEAVTTPSGGKAFIKDLKQRVGLGKAMTVANLMGFGLDEKGEPVSQNTTPKVQLKKFTTPKPLPYNQRVTPKLKYNIPSEK